MSDINGTEAFDNVLDRLLDKAEQASMYSRQRDDERGKSNELQRAVRDLERDLANARGEVARLKALVTPEALAADEERRKADPDPIPF